MDDAALEARLRDLAEHLDVPPFDLRSVLRTDLVIGSSGSVRSSASVRAGWRVAATIAVVLLVTAGTLVALSAGTREAVADWFGIRGVEITSTEAPATADVDLPLGEPSSLASASRQAGFELLLPPVDEYGEPDGVFTVPFVGGVRVALAYEAGNGLPALDGSGIGLLVTELRADADLLAIQKGLTPGTEIEEASVDGAPAVWISGGPHTVTFADEQGRFVEETSRLGGNTLLWERGTLTLRIESRLTLSEAVEIAEAMTA